ncbi:hypothetical protein Tco_1103014 [Tanacetum coccineum]
MFKNRARINNDNDGIQTNQEWFDDNEPMKDDDDDDIGDLDDYLIPKDAPYYVDEEEEGFKERRSKLLRIPYKKPPMFKSEKFEDSDAFHNTTHIVAHKLIMEDHTEQIPEEFSF